MNPGVPLKETTSWMLLMGVNGGFCWEPSRRGGIPPQWTRWTASLLYPTPSRVSFWTPYMSDLSFLLGVLPPAHQKKKEQNKGGTSKKTHLDMFRLFLDSLPSRFDSVCAGGPVKPFGADFVLMRGFIGYGNWKFR